MMMLKKKKKMTTMMVMRRTMAMIMIKVMLFIKTRAIFADTRSI